MIRASVPETAVDENRYPRRSEREIRAPRKLWEVHPEAKATAMQFTADQHFRASA
jgi:hypothetical protein